MNLRALHARRLRGEEVVFHALDGDVEIEIADAVYYLGLVLEDQTTGKCANLEWNLARSLPVLPPMLTISGAVDVDR